MIVEKLTPSSIFIVTGWILRLLIFSFPTGNWAMDMSDLVYSVIVGIAMIVLLKNIQGMRAR